MKQLICISILLFFGASQCRAAELSVNDWGPVTNGVQMSIALKEAVTNINNTNQVVLSVVYTNLTTDKVYYFKTPGDIWDDPAYTVLVVMPSGKEINPHGDPNWIRATHLFPLKPGQSEAFDFNLSKICRFDESGAYTIRIQRLTHWIEGDETHEVKVESNPLTVKVEKSAN